MSSSDTWYKPTDSQLRVTTDKNKLLTWNKYVKNAEWLAETTHPGTSGVLTFSFTNKNDACLAVDPSLIDATWFANNICKELWSGTTGISASSWAEFCTRQFVQRFVRPGYNVFAQGTGSDGDPVFKINGVGAATHEPVIGPSNGHKTDSNIYSKNVLDEYGIGVGYNLVGGLKYINKLYNIISIVNSFNSQQFTYKDASSQASSASGWNDETMIEVECYPDLNWSLQENGNKVPLNTSETTNKTYYSFQATKMQDVNPIWSENTFLGSTANDTNIVVFNEECVPVESGIERITNSETQFNRNGYYMDTSGNLIPKTDNIVKSGEIRYKKMLWSSESVSPSELCIQTVSGVCGESVHLGGGMPLCQSPTETTGSKVKLHYKVTKLDGTPIDSAAGDLPIKITLSNKQFVNGNLASGAANRGEFTTTVNSSSPEGDWISNAFQMATKEKLWLNAYAITKGYNVVISNIDVS